APAKRAIQRMSEFMGDRHRTERAKQNAALLDDEQTRRRRRPRIDIDAETPQRRRTIAVTFGSSKHLYADAAASRELQRSRAESIEGCRDGLASIGVVRNDEVFGKPLRHRATIAPRGDRDVAE